MGLLQKLMLRSRSNTLISVRRVTEQDRRGVRYPLAGMLAVVVTAVLAGARSFAAIGDWAGEMTGEQLRRLGIGAAPDESTLRKVFARVDADALDRQIGAFV
jgi:hypothetical protein